MGVLFFFLMTFYSGNAKHYFQNIARDVLNKKGRYYTYMRNFNNLKVSFKKPLIGQY